MNKSKFFDKTYFCLFVMIFILSYPLYLRAKDQASAVDEEDVFDLPNRIY